MRLLFYILMLANATFFAYGWFGPGAQAGGDAQIISQQLNPEKIRLLRPEQVGTLTRDPAAAKPEAVKPEAVKPEAAKPEAVKSVSACLEWGAFGNSDLARVEQALAPLALGAKLSQRRQEDIAGFWVYIGPLASRQFAVQKAGELKRLGVDDYFIVTDDPKWRNSVSLGVFTTEDAAKSRLAALRAKGVRSATIGARETQQGRTYFQVRDANPGLVAKLNEFKQGYAGTELRECAADEKKG
ncbi:MAG: SPOR domain-containing protein [Pseudomonadota bacterium]